MTGQLLAWEWIEVKFYCTFNGIICYALLMNILRFCLVGPAGIIHELLGLVQPVSYQFQFC